MTDFHIADHGSIVTIRPVSEAAREWLDENVDAEPWQWLGGALCVDHRFARDLVDEIAARRLRDFPLIGPSPQQLRAAWGRGVAALPLRSKGDPSWVNTIIPSASKPKKA